ncbi:MAG: pilus assembly protein N-terminal domain-containing protein, partial [Planctomycetota bacterium]
KSSSRSGRTPTRSELPHDFNHSAPARMPPMRVCPQNLRHVISLATASFAMLIGACFLGDGQSVVAQSASSLTSISADHTISQTVERMDMIVKSSRVLSLGDRIPRFQVHNEEVLGATPVSENQIQVFAKNPGTTQINLWDTDDKLYTIDVTVVADAREVEGILSSQLPLATLRVTPINESAILSGYVTSVDDVDRAVAIAEQFYTVVINNIEVVGVQQVLMHTKILEVSRTKLRKLGVDLVFADDNFNVLNGPSSLLNVAGNATPGATALGSVSTGRMSINGNFESLLEALQQDNLVKLLAEPTVVATHGRPARFTVGGRVPYIIPAGANQFQVAYEDYGTSIDFLPFVIGPGRIRLEVRPEVSEPDEVRGIRLDNTIVPAFTTRYVETAVEMQAGQTFALAGLLQSRSESIARRTPFLGHLPYVGTLFRNIREERNEIELLIMVTPELVDAMDPMEVPIGGPGLNSDSPDNKELYCYGHIEVPNLKGDRCDQEGYCEGDCIDHGLMGSPIMGEEIISPSTVGPMTSESTSLESSSPPSVMYNNMPSASTNVPKSQIQTSEYATPSMPSRSGTRPEHRISRSRQQSAQASSARKDFGAGDLIPPKAIRPGQDPTIVGEGVTVSVPSYR